MNDVIYIKLINGRWRVWRGDANDPLPKPAKSDAYFPFRCDAVQYASDWANSSYNCGVKELGEMKEAT